jgi:AcrR family transcriptional regulator
MSCPRESSSMLDHIISAARRCFARSGVRATSMQHVADEAGVSRQTVYETVARRDRLIELAIYTRCVEITEQFAWMAMGIDPVEKAFSEMVLATVTISASDPELRHMLETTPNFQVHDLMTGKLNAVDQLNYEVFKPLLARARKQGRLRRDASDHELADWIRGVCMMLIMRSDLGPAEQRSIVERFLIASICAPADASTAKFAGRFVCAERTPNPDEGR